MYNTVLGYTVLREHLKLPYSTILWLYTWKFISSSSITYIGLNLPSTELSWIYSSWMCLLWRSLRCWNPWFIRDVWQRQTLLHQRWVPPLDPPPGKGTNPGPREADFPPAGTRRNRDTRNQGRAQEAIKALRGKPEGANQGGVTDLVGDWSVSFEEEWNLPFLETLNITDAAVCQRSLKSENT